MVGVSPGPVASGWILACWSRLVAVLVTMVTVLVLGLVLALVLLSILVLVLVPLLVVVAPLLWGGPALVRLLLLVVVGSEAVVQVVVVALVGAGVCLLLPGVQLQRAVPHSVATVDQQT